MRKYRSGLACSRPGVGLWSGVEYAHTHAAFESTDRDGHSHDLSTPDQAAFTMNGLAPNTYDRDLERLWGKEMKQPQMEESQAQMLQWTDDDEEIPEAQSPPSGAEGKTLAPRKCGPVSKGKPLWKAGKKMAASRTGNASRKTALHTNKKASARSGNAPKTALRVSQFVADKHGRLVFQHPVGIHAGLRAHLKKGAHVLAPATKADFEQFVALIPPFGG